MRTLRGVAAKGKSLNHRGHRGAQGNPAYAKRCATQNQIEFSGGLLIQPWLAWRAGLPAAMDPEPLVGIAADEVFDDFGEFGGVGYYVGLVVTGANQLY